MPVPDLMSRYRGTAGEDVRAFLTGEDTQDIRGKRTANNMDRSQVEDMIAASEARTDTKFARLEGKLDLILERFESTSAKSAMQIQTLADQEAAEREHVRSELAQIRGDYKATRNTVIGTGISVVVLVVAVLTLYVTALSTGAALAPSHAPAVIEQTPQANQIETRPTPKALAAPTQNKS